MLKKYLRTLNSLDVFSWIGLCLFLVVYPFFMINRYFSITLEKTLFFFGASAFFAVGCLILRRKLKKRVRLPLIRKNRTELFMTVFMALGFVSCALSASATDAIIGDRGRNMGLTMFLFIWLAYIFVSRFGQFKTHVAVVFGVSVILMNLIAFLQFSRLNPFGLYTGVKAFVKQNFMTMLGNKDVYYYYLSLAVPFALLLTFEAKERWEKIFWYGVGLSGFIGIIVCNSEGGYICLLVAFAYFLLIKCKDRPNTLVFLRLLMLFFAAGLLISFLKFNFADAHIREGAITVLLINPYVCGAGLAVSTALYVLLLKKEPSAGFYTVLRKASLIAIVAAVAVLLAAFIGFTFIWKDVTLGKLGTLLRFSDKWGNGRGEIWSNMAHIYASMPLPQKLFGAGQESITVLMDQYLPEVVKANAHTLDNAHNEYLQYLITQGLFGLVFYLLFAVSAVRNGFKEGGVYQRAAALAAVCCLVQTTVNITQSLTTPLLYVFFALTQTREIAVPPKVKAAPTEESADGAVSAEETDVPTEPSDETPAEAPDEKPPTEESNDVPPPEAAEENAPAEADETQAVREETVVTQQP